MLLTFVFIAGIALASSLSAAPATPGGTTPVPQASGTAGKPSAPDLHDVVTTSACAVELQWYQAESVDRFKLKIGQSNFSEIPSASVKPQVSGSGEKTYVQTGLTPGTAYPFQLIASNNVGGDSTPSNARSGSAATLPAPPAPPTNISVVEWDEGGGAVVLTWTPTSEPNYSGFRIYRSDSGSPFNAIATIPLSGDSSFKRGVVVNDGSRVANTWSNSVASSSLHIYKIKTYRTDEFCGPNSNAVVDNNTTENLEWVSFSAFSGELVIPRSPSFVRVKATDPSVPSAQFEWGNAGGQENTFQFEVATDPAFPAPHDFKISAAGDLDSDFIPLQPNLDYYYRVRAVTNRSGNIGYSNFQVSPAPHHSGYLPPQDLRFSIVPQPNATTADVALSWGDNEGHVHRTRIYRKLSTDPSFGIFYQELNPIRCIGTFCEYPTTFTDAGLALGNTAYDYEVRFFINEANSEGVASNRVSVNLNLSFPDQWGWANVGADGTNFLGLGWVRFAYDAMRSAWGTSTVAADRERYGTAVDGNGMLSGYAWTPRGGWLSFNASDLAGCPRAPCEAKVDFGTEVVSGWARFTAADPSKGAWHGWVSLSSKSGEPAYGMRYDRETRQLTGEAWGGDVTGWLAFADLGGLEAPNFIAAENVTDTSFVARWANPVAYDVIKIKGSASDEHDLQIVQDPSLLSPGEKTSLVRDLISNTTYQVVVQGEKIGSGIARSNSRPVTTLAPGAAAGYTFICRATSENSISLSWVAPPSTASELKLYTSDTESGIRGGSRQLLAPPPTLSPSGGSINHDGLASGSPHYYLLEADGTFYPTDGPVLCTTLPTIPQDPATLQVVPLGPASLYVTWKDNATRPHNFVLERIKVTPATSTDVTATRSGGSSVTVTWANPTNGQLFRSPYYHVVERSANLNFAASVSSSVVFSDDMTRYTPNPTNPKTTDYSFTDANALSGTLYYRVKACSLIKVDYNRDGSPDEVCAAATPANNGEPAAVLASPPRAASLLSAVKDMAIDTAAWVGDFLGRLTGQVGAVGLANVADGAQINLNTYYGQSATTLTFATNPGVYRDNGLEPDTVYLYRAKTAYTDQAGGETSYTNEGAAKTLGNGATTPVQVRICVRNNLCGTTSGLSGGAGNAPVNQCATNAQCRNVGTTRQFFEER